MSGRKTVSGYEIGLSIFIPADMTDLMLQDRVRRAVTRLQEAARSIEGLPETPVVRCEWRDRMKGAAPVQAALFDDNKIPIRNAPPGTPVIDDAAAGAEERREAST